MDSQSDLMMLLVVIQIWDFLHRQTELSEAAQQIISFNLDTELFHLLKHSSVCTDSENLSFVHRRSLQLCHMT